MDAHTPSQTPKMTCSRQPGLLRIRAEGAWTVTTSLAAEDAFACMEPSDEKRVIMDLGAITEIDSVGAWIIHRERARMEFLGRAVDLINTSDRMRFLLCEIERHVPHPDDLPRQPYFLVRCLITIGRTMTMVWRDLVALLSILGVFGLRLATAFTAFHKLRGTSILSNFDRTCIGAVPIVMLMSFLIGLVIAQQGGFYLQTFGADLFVVDLAGVLILREIGVLLAAILVAGRSGSAFTAEIGSMRMREEVDALHVLGLDPVEVLVVPRLIALMLALPVLAFLS
ncbi:MAG: ABC transporter permease, partial [Pseudomonadota bacterium]